MQKLFKVVKILDDYKLAINAGSEQNVSVGQKFLIFSLSDEEIIDPDTNQSLGFLEIVKGTGIVTHVQEKTCTLESDVYHSSSKKVKRTSPLIGLASSIEEIESDKIREPFQKLKVGDFAKRVN